MNGKTVVEYSYDPWGKPMGITGSKAGSLGFQNPFRYRGYVWDEETGLYVTATRYYNPEWGRFLNADSLFGKTGALLSHNLFAYCLNNPIAMTDKTGRAPWWEQVRPTDVKSLGWRDIFESHYGFEPGTTKKRSVLEKQGTATVIDMLTGESFEMTFAQVCDDGYHIDGNLVDKTAGIDLFGRLLGTKYSNGNYNALKNAGLKDGRPAIIVMTDSDGDTVMSYGSLVPFLHFDSGDFSINGHFDFYLKDSVSSHTPGYPLADFTKKRRKVAQAAAIIGAIIKFMLGFGR